MGAGALDREPHEYDSLLLEGGGVRCVFTLGFLEAAGPSLVGVRQIAAVSASAVVACMHLCGEHRPGLERLVAAMGSGAASDRRRSSRTALYHHVILGCLEGRRFACIRDSRIRVRVLWGATTSRLRAMQLTALTLLRQRTHPAIEYRVTELNRLHSAEDAAAVIRATSALPPFTPSAILDGRAAVDGSVVEPVPLSALDGARAPLLVLNEPAPPRPISDHVPRIGPALPLPVSLLGGTDEAIRQAYELGLRTGERFAAGRGSRG